MSLDDSKEPLTLIETALRKTMKPLPSGHDALHLKLAIATVFLTKIDARRASSCRRGRLLPGFYLFDKNIGAVVEIAALKFVKRDKIHGDRKSTRLNSSHVRISYAVFCLK